MWLVAFEWCFSCLHRQVEDIWAPNMRIQTNMNPNPSHSLVLACVFSGSYLEHEVTTSDLQSHCSTTPRCPTNICSAPRRNNTRPSSREVRIIWYQLFSVVYFGRGTLPTKQGGKKGTTGGPRTYPLVFTLRGECCWGTPGVRKHGASAPYGFLFSGNLPPKMVLSSLAVL